MSLLHSLSWQAVPSTDFEASLKFPSTWSYECIVAIVAQVALAAAQRAAKIFKAYAENRFVCNKMVHICHPALLHSHIEGLLKVLLLATASTMLQTVHAKEMKRSLPNLCKDEVSLQVVTLYCETQRGLSTVTRFSGGGASPSVAALHGVTVVSTVRDVHVELWPLRPLVNPSRGTFACEAHACDLYHIVDASVDSQESRALLSRNC